jgi:hypothetical protein
VTAPNVLWGNVAPGDHSTIFLEIQELLAIQNLLNQLA